MDTSPKFYYKFFARTKRFLPNHQQEYIVSEKIFRSEKPIDARQKAFEYYQNYIEVLLQSIGKRYVNDEQARIDLEPLLGFVCINLVLEGKRDNDDNLYWNELDYHYIQPGDGWGVSGEYLIHSIPIESLDSLMLNLQIELYYYDLFKYETRDQVRVAIFYGQVFDSHENVPFIYPWSPGKIEDRNILVTPFDWNKFKEPFERESITDQQIGDWTGFNFTLEDIEAENEDEDYKDGMATVSENTIDYIRRSLGLSNDLTIDEVQKLISEGEGPKIEFKPSLLYNYGTSKPGIGVKNIIAKAICAFLNSSGGTLLVGVTDEGIIQGLKDDYSCAPSGKDPRDYLQLEFDQLLRHFFPKYVIQYLDARVVTIDNEDLFVIQVWPSNQPVFIKVREENEFYIRTQASSIEIKDKKELVEYCLSKWGRA